jgi:hypothetical protein
MKGELSQPCAVTFWTFATPVLVGNLAVLGVGALVNLYCSNEESTTRKTAVMFAKLSAFWAAAGLTWIVMNKRNGAIK